MKNICTMKNALNAYQKARRCKRYRPEVLEFEANREEYLGKAIRELESLTYTPGKYKVFKVWEPKERIIMALPFYDRVIQHMIVNYIEPIFEHQFIYHSYACRKWDIPGWCRHTGWKSYEPTICQRVFTPIGYVRKTYTSCRTLHEIYG